MKTAFFKHLTRHKKFLHGKVTLNDNGKVSISISDPKCYSAAERYMAKKTAMAIVDADFIHEGVVSLQVVKSDSGLIKKLADKTQDLKESYIESVKKWSASIFKGALKKSKYTKEEWLHLHDVKFEIRPDRFNKEVMVVNLLPTEGNNKAYNRMRDDKEKTLKLVESGYEFFEGREVKHAIDHYESSLRKLANRLNSKGITDQTDIDITTAIFAVNLEITIKHGTSITKAWTIIAEGEINRPHYRYLVK